jgi:hypothetical protein
MSTQPWSEHGAALRHAILSKDPRAFLTWDVIANTMSPPPYARFVRRERRYLESCGWSGLIRGSSCLDAANAVHQAYHLCRFERETSIRIRDFDLMLEFGGGYGEMRRIVDRIGFTGRYIIFDLAELNALQRYYLRASRISGTATLSDLRAVRAALESERNSRKLFISTWSFDETPLKVREEWRDLLVGFDAFLIAYQVNFAGIDNWQFFENWRKRFPRIAWRKYVIRELKDSYYLFGVASAA